MKKYVNGEYVQMTAEEIAALSTEPENAPTLEERLTALETAHQKILDKLNAFLPV